MKDKDIDLNMTGPLREAVTSHKGGSHGSMGEASMSDLDKGYTLGAHTHDSFSMEDEPWQDRWAYRNKGGFLTRPIGDER